MGRAEWSPSRTWTISGETQETLLPLGTVRWTMVVWGSAQQAGQHIQTAGKHSVSGVSGELVAFAATEVKDAAKNSAEIFLK